MEITVTEVFYLNDYLGKLYWELKEKGEDPVVLKNILSLSDKFHKARYELEHHNKTITIQVVKNRKEEN